MIATVLRISWLRLWHNRGELLLTFVVPLLFFSIFAWIFGSRSDGGTPRIKIAVADPVADQASEAITAALVDNPSLRLMGSRRKVIASASDRSSQTIEVDYLPDAAAAEDWVRRGLVTAAVVFRPTDTPLPKAEVWADSYDQVAPQLLSGMVARAMARAAADPRIVAPGRIAAQPISYTTSSGDGAAAGEVPIRDVIGRKQANPTIAMYAAGIAVMFSLFSAATAGGALLEEKENSTLDRLLCSRMTIDHLLLGKWLYLTILGSLQITLMFVFGAVAFGIELWQHLGPFVVVTVVCSGAAASFALLLSTLCSSRLQLGWISTIVILVMSALGGSMVPRYLMSETVQQAGMFTFNAWALEAYNKIFWRQLPLRAAETELAVMLGCGFAMLVAARLAAIRWERV